MFSSMFFETEVWISPIVITLSVFFDSEMLGLDLSADIWFSSLISTYL